MAQTIYESGTSPLFWAFNWLHQHKSRSTETDEPIQKLRQFDLSEFKPVNRKDEEKYDFTEEWPQQLELNFSSESEQRRKPQIAKPPGSKIMALVCFFYSAKSVEQAFEPIYADFCEEYFAALATGEKWHARWIRVRYYKNFAKAVGLFGVVRLAKTVFAYWEKIA